MEALTIAASQRCVRVSKMMLTTRLAVNAQQMAAAVVYFMFIKKEKKESALSSSPALSKQLSSRKINCRLH